MPEPARTSRGWRGLDFDTYQAMRRFPAFDGLRAIAATMVLTFHFAGPNWQISGWSGVQIFFVLSGFLITTLALREEGRDGRMSLYGFYVRRVMRIVPVYMVVLFIIAGVFFVRDELKYSGTYAALPYYLSTFFADFAPEAPYQQSWTIGIEQKFYLLWPLLAFGLGALTMVRRLGLTLALIGGTVAGMVVLQTSWLVHYATILCGCLLALLMNHRRTYALIRPLTHPLVGLVTLAGVVVAQLKLLSLPGFYGLTFGILAYSVVVAVWLPSLLGTGLMPWLLSRRPLAFVGDRSYSLYLIQSLAGLVVLETLHVRASLLQFAVVWLLSLLAADTLYRWVERPMIEVGQRHLRTRSGRRATPPEPTAIVPAAPTLSPATAPLPG